MGRWLHPILKLYVHAFVHYGMEMIGKGASLRNTLPWANVAHFAVTSQGQDTALGGGLPSDWLNDSSEYGTDTSQLARGH